MWFVDYSCIDQKLYNFNFRNELFPGKQLYVDMIERVQKFAATKVECQLWQSPGSAWLASTWSNQQKLYSWLPCTFYLAALSSSHPVSSLSYSPTLTPPAPFIHPPPDPLPALPPFFFALWNNLSLDTFGYYKFNSNTSVQTVLCICMN